MGKTIIWDSKSVTPNGGVQVLDYDEIAALVDSLPSGTERTQTDIEQLIARSLRELPTSGRKLANLPLDLAIEEGRLPKKPVFYDGTPLNVVVTIPDVATYSSLASGEQTTEFTFTRVLSILGDQYIFLATDSPRDPNSLVALEHIANGLTTSNTLPLVKNPIVRDRRNYYAVQAPVSAHDERIILKDLEGGTGILRFVYNVDKKEIEVLKFAKRTGDPADDERSVQLLKNDAWMLGEVFRGEDGFMPLYDFKKIGGEDCLIMPYANMNSEQFVESIRRLFEKGHREAPTEYFYYMASQLCNVIQKWHDKNVIYLDLKMEQVMWKLVPDSKPKIWVTDFGAATTYERTRRGEELIFTQETVEPQLMVPWFGAMYFGKDVDKSNGTACRRMDYETQSDVYSLGATLEQILAKALGVTLNDDYKSAITTVETPASPRHTMHPSFVFKKIDADRKNMAALRKRNKELKMFDEHVFAFVEHLKAPRLERPEIEDIAIIADGAGKNYSFSIQKPKLGEIDTHPYRFALFDAKEDANHTIAKAIRDAASFISVNQQNGWIYGRVEYGELVEKKIMVVKDRMSMKQAKRFTDFAYLDPRYAEPEEYLTYEFPALAPANQREYWQKEQRLDIEAEAKIYEIGMVVLRYIAKELGVETELHTFDVKQAKSLVDKRLAGLQTLPLDEVLASLPVRGIAGYLALQHNADFETIQKANDEQKKYDPAIFDLLADMFKPRNERITFDELRERAHNVAMQYKRQ
ncbi:protein kinase family protein [Candidatus Woesearchaeota archaeon]|nr:protein kinase family protein [Candidatus Woesearchaeota archaeon]